MATLQSGAIAQPVHEAGVRPCVWLSGGFGFGDMDTDGGGLGGSVDLSYNIGSLIVSARYVEIADLSFGGFSFGGWGLSPPDVRVQDIGLLVGLVRRWKHGFASTSAGISLVKGLHRFEQRDRLGERTYATQEFVTIGFPIELQLFWTPTTIAGIGIHAYADFNREKNFVGISLCLVIGTL